MNIWVWPGDKAPVCWMAHSGITQRKEGKNDQSKVVFFDAKGVVHKEFVPPGQTIKDVY